MKKIVVLFSLLVLMASSSMAALSMGIIGAYYSYSGASAAGYGLEVGLGLIPFIDTRLVAVYIPINSTSSLIPATLNLKFVLPGVPVYVDAGAGYLLYNNSATGVTSPTGSLTYNAALGYEYGIMPYTALFIQGGYEGLTVKYTLGGVNYETNYSGVGAKAGIRFNI